ncbi:hypothetical protein B0H10DRAFT_2011154 [Mycena sp. CBHHK59/15]|nr:hypothetical protein B0H10DRAFT_2011154 [Mycena sp. CBHHK59/15]
MLDGGELEHNMMPEGEINFDHMNLSGSFVLQSISCRDMRGRDSATGEDESTLPALVLTFPTPEQPKSPVLAQQPPLPVHKVGAAAASGDSIPSRCDQRPSSLAVPALPHCTHCGFGFGLDFHNLETPLSNNPCRFCEPQWLACEILREPCVVRPVESKANSRALRGRLSLPIGTHRGLMKLYPVSECYHQGQDENKAQDSCNGVEEGYKLIRDPANCGQAQLKTRGSG